LTQHRVVIGRQSDVEICLDDSMVSRRHAELAIGPDGRAVIRDLGSRNGTFCNERRVTEEVLHDGDLIRIGSTALKYLEADSVEHLYVSVMADRAAHDGLTGLFNKRTFQDHLRRAFSRCRNLHEPLSVILVDVDFFKRINDQWGHPAGDYVLKEIAVRLKDGFRPTDLFARWGGEELGLILPYTTGKEAAAVAERMRAGVASPPFVFEGRTIEVRISLGVAEMVESVEDADALVAHADRALYAAKREGRDRVACFADPPRSPARRRARRRAA
jgi:diguanylate cyclase (GGDEF)-like protein